MASETLPVVAELPFLLRLTQKTFLLVFPLPQLQHHKRTGKREETQKMLVRKGFVQLHNTSQLYKKYVIIDFCP